MLDLEIADYERSIKALNTQLINKDKEIVDMKNEVSQTNEKLSQFKAEKESTEKEKEQLEEKCIKLKELLIKAQKELADVKQSETERLSSDASQKAQLQTLTIEIENYKLQITEMSVERVKIQEKLHFIQENNQRNANLLEAKILSLTNELENSNSRYTQLQSDYENYKVKAQNAFKKQKESTETNSNAINSGDIQRYLAEIEQLKSGVNKLKEKLETTEERLQIVEKENDYVQEEYSRCLERNTKLMTELKEKEVEWKNK
jgi:chromosome segregation ATPase